MNPETLGEPTEYTQVISVTGRRLVFVAGQVSSDEHGNVVGKGDFRAQARQVYANVGTALAAAGATFSDVAKMTVFIVGFNRERDYNVLREVRAELLPTERWANSLVGVQTLAKPDYLIEVQAIAVLDA